MRGGADGVAARRAVLAYVLRVVREARLLGIHEYRSALGMDGESVILWLVVGALAVVAGRSLPVLARRERQDRILLMAGGVLAVAALVSLRNAPFFVLLAAPALARFAPRAAERRPRPASRGALALIGLTTLVAIASTGYRWRSGGVALGWAPLAPPAIAAVQTCPAPMYNAFGDGGALIWFVPEQRVFMDGRTDAYPAAFLLRASRAELRGEYKSLFADYHIRCAVVGASSRMARLLHDDPSMELRFADARWSVFQRAP